MGVDLGLGPVLKIVFTYLERAGMTSEVSTGQEGPGSGRDSKFFAGGNAPNQTEGKNSLGCLPPYEDVSIRHCLKSRVSCLFPRGRVVSPFELAQLELFSPFNLSTFQPFNLSTTTSTRTQATTHQTIKTKRRDRLHHVAHRHVDTQTSILRGPGKRTLRHPLAHVGR